MKEMTKRSFLGKLLTGLGVSLLGLLPGSFFSRGKAFAADTLETALPKINKSNILKDLPALKLSQEDKLAVAAVRMIPPAELKTSIAKIRAGERVPSAAGGAGCGGGCNGWGFVCGAGCSPGKDTIGAFDPKGQLGINMKGINKGGFLQSVDKAMAMTPSK